MKRRVLVLVHPSLVPPESDRGVPGEERNLWKTEYDVVSTLRRAGNDVRVLGVDDELLPIRREVEGWRPHVVFNLLEEFHGLRDFVPHVVSYLELLRVPYTGCGPHGLILAGDKALAKKLLAYHRIRSAEFVVVRRGRAVRRPKTLDFPLIVKSLTEEASTGISQASIVGDDARLADRVRFVHDSVGTDAIVEEYIDGRELYVGVLGAIRPRVLPVWELFFENLAARAPAIATARVKHDPDYQETRGIFQARAELSAPESDRVRRIARRIYRILGLDGYARIDFRLRPDGGLYFLEANPNPEIARGQEFAESAEADGLAYHGLLRRIVDLGIRRGRRASAAG